MRITTKIISVAASVALVAGAGALAATPASAAKSLPKTSGKTILDLTPNVAAALTAAGIKISVVKPATLSTSPKVMVGFPVTGLDGASITHSGGVTFTSTGNPTGITGSNPIITPGDDNTATISLTVLGTPVDLLYTKHDGWKYGKWTTDKSHSKWIIKRTVTVKGDLHLTSSSAVVDLLNSVLVTTVFTPDMGLGTTRTTVNEVRICKANTTASCKKAQG